MTITAIPSIFYEFAFNADPNQSYLPPYWSDLSNRVQYGWKLVRGRQYELDANETGMWTVELANNDGALDPNNAASPYAPGVVPYRPCRIRVVVGNNLLAPDQASAGQWAPLAAGPLPAWLGVTAAAGNTLAIAAVGASAYEGSQVYTTTVPSGTAAPSTVVQASVLTVTAGQTYTFSIQAQVITSGQNPTVAAAIDWMGTAGTVLSTSTGTGVGLTGASGTWTQAVVTATAPSAAVAATVRLSTSTVPSANTVIWTDGLQLEARGYATRWQLPWAPSVNLLPRTIATGTETMATTDQVGNWFWATSAGTLTRSVFLATAAPSGQTTAAAWTLPAGSYGASPGLYTGYNPSNLVGPIADCAQVTAGRTYTGSVYVTRVGTDPTVQMSSSIIWYDNAGNGVNQSFGGGVTIPTSGWARVTVTGAAPASAVWGRLFIYMSSASLAATETFYATGWQMEQAASASTWADPGPPVFLHTGMVERWPETWNDLDGTYGTSQLECPDAFAALAQPELELAYIAELLTYSPNFVYALDDPAGSVSCVDAAGRRAPAPVENSPYGVGSATFGSGVTSTSPTLGFVGTPGPVLTLAGNSSSSSPHQFGETYVSLHKTTATPGPPASGGWTRIICFRAPTAPAGGNSYQLWYSTPASWQSNPSLFQIHIEVGGHLNVQFIDLTGLAGVTYAGAGSVCDGNWHMVAIGASDPAGGTGTNTVWVDGVQVATASGVNFGYQFAVDVIGALVLPGNSWYSSGFNGDVALAAELPTLLTGAQVSALYNSWRTASSGDASGARFSRVLRWIGWTGPTAIDAGSTTSMGPATDLEGQSALNGLTLIAATENGEQYMSSAGVLTFKARSALYGARTPQVVFGEGRPVGSAGEWPYELGSIDFDPSHLANKVKVTQYQGPVYTAVDAASQQRYFPRKYERTVNTMLSSEAQDAATYLLSQLKAARQRADTIRAHPSAVVGLFPVLAQLDKSTRIRMIKRPIGAPATVMDAYTQRIAWTCSPDSDFWAEYQASPADLANYWNLGALHTTLSAQANSGQNHATINALPDAATNKLAQSLPAGYLLTFEPGTARAETIAVAAGGIPSTSLGYSTATLTMATNLAFTHPAGSVVCEALPAGYTDPTAWDPSSVIGAAYVTIAVPPGSGGGGGTQLPISALSDAAANAAVQDWYPGQTLWISPGTPRFQTQTLTAVSFTTPGWTYATLTFASLTAGWQFGDLICEPLPGGISTPTAINATARAAY